MRVRLDPKVVSLVRGGGKHFEMIGRIVYCSRYSKVWLYIDRKRDEAAACGEERQSVNIENSMHCRNKM